MTERNCKKERGEREKETYLRKTEKKEEMCDISKSNKISLHPSSLTLGVTHTN